MNCANSTNICPKVKREAAAVPDISDKEFTIKIIEITQIDDTLSIKYFINKSSNFSESGYSCSIYHKHIDNGGFQKSDLCVFTIGKEEYINLAISEGKGNYNVCIGILHNETTYFSECQLAEYEPLETTETQSTSDASETTTPATASFSTGKSTMPLTANATIAPVTTVSHSTEKTTTPFTANATTSVSTVPLSIENTTMPVTANASTAPVTTVSLSSEKTTMPVTVNATTAPVTTVSLTSEKTTMPVTANASTAPVTTVPLSSEKTTMPVTANASTAPATTVSLSSEKTTMPVTANASTATATTVSLPSEKTTMPVTANATTAPVTTTVSLSTEKTTVPITSTAKATIAAAFIHETSTTSLVEIYTTKTSKETTESSELPTVSALAGTTTKFPTSFETTTGSVGVTTTQLPTHFEDTTPSIGPAKPSFGLFSVKSFFLHKNAKGQLLLSWNVTLEDPQAACHLRFSVFLYNQPEKHSQRKCISGSLLLGEIANTDSYRICVEMYLEQKSVEKNCTEFSPIFQESAVSSKSTWLPSKLPMAIFILLVILAVIILILIIIVLIKLVYLKRNKTNVYYVAKEEVNNHGEITKRNSKLHSVSSVEDDKV